MGTPPRQIQVEKTIINTYELKNYCLNFENLQKDN